MRCIQITQLGMLPSYDLMTFIGDFFPHCVVFKENESKSTEFKRFFCCKSVPIFNSNRVHHRFIEELLSWSSFKNASRFKHLPTSSCLMCVRSQSFQERVWCWSLCLHLDHRLCLQLPCLSRSPNKFLFSCRVGSVFAFQSIFFFFFLNLSSRFLHIKLTLQWGDTPAGHKQNECKQPEVSHCRMEVYV